MGGATATEDTHNTESSTTTSELDNTGTCPANLEAYNIDTSESCAVTSAKKLLKTKDISYNITRLNVCICKDKDCNASIATINKCLEESGLKTYTYKTNQTLLKTGDIIHLEINGIGHYTIYEENKTDLTNFTGYTITTKELKNQKTIPLTIQEKIHGQSHTITRKYVTWWGWGWCRVGPECYWVPWLPGQPLRQQCGYHNVICWREFEEWRWV